MGINAEVLDLVGLREAPGCSIRCRCCALSCESLVTSFASSDIDKLDKHILKQFRIGVTTSQ
jgi:hypothetical protein